MLENLEFRKMDLLFYNSIQKNKKLYASVLIFHLLQTLLFAIFLPIDLLELKTQSKLVVAFMSVALAISAFNTFMNILILAVGYSNNTENNIKFLTIAQIGHLVDEPLQKQNTKDLINCVSNIMYNQPNQTFINDEGLTQQIKSRYENVISYVIEGEVMKYMPGISGFDNLAKFGGVCTFVFGIVALSVAKPSPSAAQLAVCIIYLVSELIIHWKYLLIALLVALSPLICIIICFIGCCCSRPGEEGGHVPEPIPVTREIIMQVESCSICQQSFKMEERVIQLNCSPKHVYHEGCLNSWLMIRQNCPICRQQIR